MQCSRIFKICTIEDKALTKRIVFNTKFIEVIIVKDFLYKIHLKISQWMYGRNGQDEFADVCCMGGAVLSVIGMIFKNIWLYLPAFVLWGYCIFRSMSKNLIRRQSENIWFLQKVDKVRKHFEINLCILLCLYCIYKAYMSMYHLLYNLREH